MSKGVRRNEVLDINDFGLLFLVNTCDPEIKKHVYFILYRLSLTGLINFYHRITLIQNNFFYIELLAISHKTGSMEPEIPEKDIYFLKSEIIKRQAVIKSNIQDVMGTASYEKTKITITINFEAIAGKNLQAAYNILKTEWSNEVIAYVLNDKKFGTRLEIAKTLYPNGVVEDSVYRKKVAELIERCNQKHIISYK